MFPTLDVANLSEDDMVGDMVIEKWKDFGGKFATRMGNGHDLGTLLRLNSQGDYTQENTTIGRVAP